MTDSDSDSFHSACDEEFVPDQLVEPEPPAQLAENVDKRTSTEPSSSSDSLPAPEKVKVEEQEELAPEPEFKVPELPKPKKSGKIEAKKSTDGWDESWGDDSASSADSESDWGKWGKEEKDDGVKKPKHRTKHHSRVEDIASDSTEADEEEGTERKKSHVKDTQHRSIWDWSGLNEVVTAVGLGIPPPEEMARLSIAQRRKILEEAQNAKEPEPSLSSDEATEPHSPAELEPAHASGFGGLFTGIMNGGLDVLESLGKKTFETLTVKDENNAERRKFFLSAVDSQGTSLSDVLKEIRATQDQHSPAQDSPKKRFGYGSTNLDNPATNFVAQFERNEGMVHLEGLELLMASQKQRILSDFNEGFDERLNEFVVEDVSECNTDDFVYELKKCLSAVRLPYKADNVLRADKELLAKLTATQETLDTGVGLETEMVHAESIQALAKFTAHSIQSLHKIAQLMVMAQNEVDAEALFAFTFVLCRRLSFFASQYANLLSLLDSNSTVDNVVTNIFFECSNACHYVKKALTYLKPFFCK